MKFSLIICTYQRPEALLKLLKSVQLQNLYPDQILVIDGSLDSITEEALKSKEFPNLSYYKVAEQERGLTKQRNFGIQKVAETSEIVCFLDDDIELTPTYFVNLLHTYNQFPNALGVGGYIIDNVEWKKVDKKEIISKEEFSIDGYKRKDSYRFIFRKKLGLMPETFPTFMPEEGHGRSVGFLPPTGKIYKVETFMGGVASYKKECFKKIKFSTFFEGYGLYEDTEFTLRLSKIGELYLNTAAKLYHHHDEDGRPNQYKFGKMVVRNGWYVWRVKNQQPIFIATFKWHLVTLLLIVIRLTNILNTPNKKQAFTESLGRTVGWFNIIFNKPKF